MYGGKCVFLKKKCDFVLTLFNIHWSIFIVRSYIIFKIILSTILRCHKPIVERFKTLLKTILKESTMNTGHNVKLYPI